MPFDDAVQAADEPLGRQREVDLDFQALSVEVAQHIQKPKDPAIVNTRRHEVHRPGRIGRVRHCQSVRLLPLQPLTGLYAQVQVQLTLGSINAFMSPRITLHVANVQETRVKTPSVSYICHSRQ